MIGKRAAIEVGAIAESGVPSTEIEAPKPMPASVPAPAPEAVKVAAVLEPEVTVESWGRGRRDPLVVAFVRDTKRGRTVKRTPTSWTALFVAWVELPR